MLLKILGNLVYSKNSSEMWRLLPAKSAYTGALVYPNYTRAIGTGKPFFIKGKSSIFTK